MSERNITYLTDVYLITCVVDRGKGEDVVKAARGAGAGGALIHSGHGVGIRERLGLLGIAAVSFGVYLVQARRGPGTSVRTTEGPGEIEPGRIPD